MKNKTTKIFLVIIFALIIGLLLTTTVKAEVTCDDTTITIPCGENVTTLDL